MSATFPAEAAVVYPDSDGEPMGDNSHQIDLIINLYQALTDHFAGRPDVAVHSNLIWYPVQGRPDIRRAPDVMVVFGRPAGRRRSYRQWEEGGVPPQVVFEIFAPGNDAKDLLAKFLFYEKYGVEEYYFFDPDTPSLSGWRLAGGTWEEIDPVAGSTSPRLGLTFDWDGLTDGFDLRAPDGGRLPTHEEVVRKWQRAQDQAEQAREQARAQMLEASYEKARADKQQRRADGEKARADEEKARAERLAAELRKLGVDPNALGGGGP